MARIPDQWYNKIGLFCGADLQKVFIRFESRMNDKGEIMWKVIIADDENLICRLVQALVDWTALDMEVVATAENGLEALEYIGKYEPDILITDIRMPGCDGLELIKQAREKKAELEIVVISGYAHFEYARTAMSYGVENYILKPIKQEELLETLQRIRNRLDERKQEKNIRQSFVRSQNDLNRLREGLIKDIFSQNKTFSRKVLEETYHFIVEDGYCQAFVLKIDCDMEKTEDASFRVIQDKAKELFEACMAPVCEEYILGFLDHTGYGIVNYLPSDKPEVRRQMHEFLHQLEGNKHLLGDVEFSLGLGSMEEETEKLPESMEKARLAVEERVLEGCGRLLETVPPSSGVRKQNLMDKYVKAAEHSIEVLDVEGVFLADENLQNSIMEVADICGREVLEIVLMAGKFFLLRMGAEDAEQMQQAFEAQCMQCGTIRDLFAVLKKLQQRTILDKMEKQESESSRPIRIAKQYIMQNFDKNITLEEVCEYVGFSPAYFSTMFKKECGEGFAKYLTRVRMEEAKNLLRETTMPVSEVCEKVGYNDRKHFTHTFHKMTGVNPAEFRKLYG